MSSAAVRASTLSRSIQLPYNVIQERRLVQPRGNSAGGEGMIEYKVKPCEGDFSHALSASETASSQPFATRAFATDGSAHDECTATGQARSHHPGSRRGNQQH